MPQRLFRRSLIWMLAALTLALGGSMSTAHLTPNSELVVDFRDNVVMIDAIIPEGDYRLASQAPPGRSTVFAERWLADQVGATTPDGRAWTAAVETAEFVQRAGPPDLHATIRLTPPTGASARRLTLRWSAVVGQNPDHFALILIGHDHGANILPQDRKLIGAVRGERQSVVINRGAPSSSAAFLSAFRLGVQHIADGTDHLLFLLTLLLTAPLVAAGGHWAGTRRTVSALLRLATIVTAFTIGHSLTLVAAALGGWSLPVAPVEVMIAVSILIAAAHAIRPIFPGREAWVAAGFGLVHGLAFATLVGDAGLAGQEQLLAILGFNLGIEAVQLMVAGVTFVPLLLIARGPDYRWVRVPVALFAAVAAIAWIIERTLGKPNFVAGSVQHIADQALWVLAALIVLALFEGTRRRKAV